MMRNLFKTLLIALAALAAGAMLVPNWVPSEARAGQAQASSPVRILALGDSLTQGFGVPRGMDFPARLERALKARNLAVTVINAGLSGDTSAGGLARLDWSLGDTANRPDAAIVELGANDGLRGLPVAAMEKNLDAILEKLRARNIPVLFAGMKGPRNFGTQYAADYDAVFPGLAKKYAVLFYPFFLEGVALDPALVQPDGLHPNPNGVDAIVTRITPLAVQLVQQAQKQQAGNQTK
jgi:acyl-CoA thioesterase-1